MKKFLMYLTVIVFSMFVFTSCVKPPECETYNTGDVIFHDNGPSWAWDGCYIEVDWNDGSYNSVTFYNTKSYYDKAAGRAEVYMEWEDADNYYWNYGYINLIQCGTVDAYCNWSKKKSTEVSGFIIEKSGSVLKTDITSKEEFRKTIIE